MITLTLQIQKDVTQKERDKAVRQLENDGWDVNVQDEEELGDNLIGGSCMFPADDFDY